MPKNSLVTKLTSSLGLLAVVATGAAAGANAAPGQAATQTRGVDVANYQGNVNWSAQRAAGTRFAYVKLTENGKAANRYAASQMAGARRAGMLVGGYDYAAPTTSLSATRAQVAAFVKAGGGWKANTGKLPGALDLETNVHGNACYGLTQSQMRTYVANWNAAYYGLTHRRAVDYGNPVFWQKCMGNTTMFNNTNPLWVANWTTRSAPAALGGQRRYTFWQYKGAASGSSVDLDRFNGSLARLNYFANHA